MLQILEGRPCLYRVLYAFGCKCVDIQKAAQTGPRKLRHSPGIYTYTMRESAQSSSILPSTLCFHGTFFLICKLKHELSLHQARILGCLRRIDEGATRDGVTRHGS